jgi:hypothetical protein
MPSSWWRAASASTWIGFWNEFAGDPTRIAEATREHYAALYARPGAMRAAFAGLSIDAAGARAAGHLTESPDVDGLASQAR